MKNPVVTLWRLLTVRFGWKVLSLVVAVLLWVVVSSEPEMATFTSVPLQYKDLPTDLEISSPLIESAYLELRGPAGELRWFGDSRRPAIVIDMSGVRAGERTFSIGNANVKLPRGVQLVRAIPAQVRFEFETRHVRSVPVTARFTEPPAGYALASYTVTPPQLRVQGPASRVERIDTVHTDPLDISRVVGSAEYRVNAFVQDSYVRFQSSPQVVVQVTVRKK